MKSLFISKEEVFGVTDSASDGMEHIPRIIHQLWKDDEIPENWQVTASSCRSVHLEENGWQVILWTDEKVERFLEDNYAWFLPTYRSYTYTIQRVDAVRYFLIYHYGGIYMDLDIGCKRDMSALLGTGSLILPSSEPFGYSNDWFAASRHHPFLLQVMKALPRYNHRYLTKYPTVMLSTGPLFLSIQFCYYFAKNSFKTQSRILPIELYGNTPTSFFSHVYGSSWHGKDAKLIMWLNDNLRLFLFSLVSIFFAVILLIFFVGFSRRRRVKKVHRVE
ncbi:mannosyltransferase complex subunit [Schizosaccharomyces japonicus yFS275]|uniref:Mannosyltransferase complex subunit n=1 Tax=Schizosaccharomyces japonicus (strain yFS275 / FY16936) TaxID=402676 RepID=B6K5H9_SCHJY|nr:mannosyltransferase complex subunit [Schizosaccharomyces japonicus yFS275]EEB08783.1 mannosyltransferase complex subunit [Schizosaccharomyces japonicus yFS275]